MTNNDFLRRIRYALNIKDNNMIKIFEMGNLKLTQEDILNLLKKEEDENFLKCNNKMLIQFLDGLIEFRRGKREDDSENIENKEDASVKIGKNNLNNIILRKLRIALSFRSENMLEVFKLGGQVISSNELSALFRKEDHKNYRECGDKYIRVFLKGLTTLYRAETRD